MTDLEINSLYEKETPIIKLIHETYLQSIKKSLEKNYFPKYIDNKKWKCFSDYSFDNKKPNNVITFTLLPYVIDFNILSSAIKEYAPKEIKKTQSINPKFIEFIKHSPFVTFSFILENHENLFLESKEFLKDSMLLSLNQIVNENIPNWTVETSHLEKYHKEIAKKTKKVIRLIEENKKIKILKNMFLITSIGSYLCTQFANKTNAEIMGWFSDRDEINDVADKYSIDLFNFQFCEYLKNRNCEFVAAPASSQDNEWYQELIKIPDFITGALADYSFETELVSHNKFIPLLRELIADNDRNVFVFKLKFDNVTGMKCARVKYFKE